MDWDGIATDSIEQQLVDDERLIGRLRARQLAGLAELDARQIATADGSRSLSEWTAARLDVGIEIGRTLVRTMRRLGDRPDLMGELASGSVTFDRVEALSRLRADTGRVGLMEWADISRIRAEAAIQARIGAETETRTVRDRFMVLQPSLDESWWDFWGGIDGYCGALVDKVLSEAADRLPRDELGGDVGWRRATALVQCLVSDEPPPAQVTVLVDASHAVPSNGEAGVVVEPGVRAGRDTLEAVLCDAVTEITARTGTGRYMEYGRRQRTAPPALKRALLAETGHMCAADGCTSRRRLQIHHVTPWAQGGSTNPDNLVVLCWYHHHVIVHERGFQIIPTPDRRRLRFKQAERGPPH